MKKNETCELKKELIKQKKALKIARKHMDSRINDVITDEERCSHIEVQAKIDAILSGNEE